MKSKIILIIISLLVLASCGGSNEGNINKKSLNIDSKTENNNSGDEKTDINNPGEDEDKISISHIVRTLDLKECDKLEGDDISECKDLINNKIAINRNDINYCNKIINEKLKKDCISNIEVSMAENITNKDDCNKLSSKEATEECVTKITIETTGLKSESDCNKISDTKLKQSCFDSYYINQVISGEQTDSSYCNKIQYDELKNECLVILKDTSLSEKNLELAQKARASGDVGGAVKLECEATNKGNLIEECMKDQYIKEGSTSGSTSLCNNIKDSNIKQECITGINSVSYKAIFQEALKNKDASLCNKISNEVYREDCKDIVGN